MVRIYNFQLSDPQVNFLINDEKITLDVFSDDFEKELGQKLIARYNEFNKEEQKDFIENLETAFNKNEAIKKQKRSFKKEFKPIFEKISVHDSKESFIEDFDNVINELLDKEVLNVFSPDLHRIKGEFTIPKKIHPIDKDKDQIRKAIDEYLRTCGRSFRYNLTITFVLSALNEAQ